MSTLVEENKRMQVISSPYLPYMYSPSRHQNLLGLEPKLHFPSTKLQPYIILILHLQLYTPKAAETDIQGLGLCARSGLE